MPRVAVSLKGIRSEGCAKPDCRTGSRSLQRHHLRHQAMWIGVWAGVRRGETRFTLFKRRYWQFRKADCTVLCDCHHSEIHFLYDILIQEHIAESGKRLYKYTWEEATNLMDKLEESCKAWLLTESPGVVPETYARHKKKQTRERKSRR